jgi:hypothetical protein
MIRAASVGNDLKAEFRNPARRLSRLVLYASIYALVRLAASGTNLSPSGRGLAISPGDVVAPSPLAQGIDAQQKVIS